MRTTHLLYLHGFRSSPQSAKAKKMAAIVRQRHPSVRWWCPQLPPSPREALQAIMDGIAAWPREAGFESLAVVGSSLGGFYATAVAERTGCKAVLLNPAVEPARDLSGYIGELRALHAGALKTPENYLAVIAKGDEVLDWREMTARYAGARIRLLEGGDHALSDFDLHVPAILDFLELA